MTEQAIHSADMMYRCRKSLRSLFKEKFFEKIKEYQIIIESVKIKKNLDTMEATVDILLESNCDEVTTMWLLATCVEMIEPTKPNER